MNQPPSTSIMVSSELKPKPLGPILFFSTVCLFILTPFFTAYNIQELVSDSINSDYEKSWNGFKWSGYTSLGILCWTNAVFSWFMPPLVSMINGKRALGLGTLVFNLSLVTFLFPFKYGLYIATVISGLAAAMLWNGQGSYLGFISNDASITRDTGICWSTLQSGAILGNIVVAYLFQGQEHISANTRTLVYCSLITFGIIGVISTCFLKTPKITGKPESVVHVFGQSIKLLATKRMGIFSITCFYSGLETAFFSTLYGTAVGFTKVFGINRKQIAGETGMLIGAGQVSAGLLLIATQRAKKPEYILAGAYVLSMLTFALVYLNLPDSASTIDTEDPAIIHSSVPLALICAFALGFADGCFETQIFRFIVKHYAENSSTPFAIYASIQNIAMGGMYVFSNYFGLRLLCILLATTCTLGTAAFFISCTIKDSSQELLINEHSDKIEAMDRVETISAD